MELNNEQKNLSKIPKLKSSNHAWRGIGVLFKTGSNIWWLSFFGILAIYLGFLFRISNIEWVLIVLAITLVEVAEAFNTALEIDMDLTSPEYHPYAKDTKDVAAGAVLLACFAASIIGLLVFGPKIIAML